MEKQLVCINCPMGCRLTVQMEGTEVLSVSGNICPKGEAYARQEAVEPMRVLTSLMRVEDREAPMSVKTSRPIPKRLMMDCVQEIFRHRAKAPLQVGDVILANVCGTGADVIATQELKA